MSWFLSSLSPQYLFLNSFSFFFITLLSLVISIFLISLSTERNNLLLFYSQIFLTFILLIVSIFFKKYFSIDSANFIDASLFIIMNSTLLTSIFYLKTLGVIDTYPQELKKLFGGLKIGFITIFLSFLFFIMPFSQGYSDARLILTKKKDVLNSIKLKGDSKLYYLVEMVNDKFVVIEPKTNNIRIMEYKDIEYIAQKD